jgi:hypothetical protein
MNEVVRVLNADGIAAFERYLLGLRGGSREAAPVELLLNPAYSSPFGTRCDIGPRKFSSRYELGVYLVEILSSANRHDLSRDCGLWTWFALYYFEQICPSTPEGSRDVRSIQAYVLPNKYDYRIYYRHLVRTPWLVVSDHAQYGRLLLVPPGAAENAPLATRGEILEQLAARQELIGNRAVIETAYRLYFDESKGRPRRGAAGSAGGSPRRLAIILQQLGLTFDLGACAAATIDGLLPREFDRWRAT